jgi:hypothetical protein
MGAREGAHLADRRLVDFLCRLDTRGSCKTQRTLDSRFRRVHLQVISSVHQSMLCQCSDLSGGPLVRHQVRHCMYVHARHYVFDERRIIHMSRAWQRATTSI